MPLRVIRRADRGNFQIVGTISFPDGTKRRIRQAPQSADLNLAREEAAFLEAQLLRSAWHGEKRGVRPYAEAVESYLTAKRHKRGTIRRHQRIVLALGDVPLSAIDQNAVNRLLDAEFTEIVNSVPRRQRFLKPNPAPATIVTGIITPIRAVMQYARGLGWCDVPEFTAPRIPRGRTNYLLPGEAQRLFVAAAPHLQPLLMFLLCTGARMAEAIELDWRDIDLVGGRVIFWRTKQNRRRIATLPPAAVAVLTEWASRLSPNAPPSGRVFKWQRRPTGPYHDYADHEREYGGQIKQAWRGALARAGLAGSDQPRLTPHDLRHTWASWHYALNGDLLLLQAEGAWSSVILVERYTHLLPKGHEQAIRVFRGEAKPALLLCDTPATHDPLGNGLSVSYAMGFSW
jgi:integrase